MTEAEAIKILARWVYELQVDLMLAEARHLAEKELLEARVARMGYWVRSGLTPLEIHAAASELDPAVVGAA